MYNIYEVYARNTYNDAIDNGSYDVIVGESEDKVCITYAERNPYYLIPKRKYTPVVECTKWERYTMEELFNTLQAEDFLKFVRNK